MADQVLEGCQLVDFSKHPSGIVPTLQNIVSMVNLDCKLDLMAIALWARNAEYNPKRSAAVIMRMREPKTTALIFACGKMVCTGAKSEQQSKLAARKHGTRLNFSILAAILVNLLQFVGLYYEESIVYAQIIQNSGFPARFKKPI